MSTNILDLIAQLETEIEESPRPKIGGSNRRIVERETIIDLISDLRVTIPDEVRWAQSVLAEKDNLLAKAHEEAETALREAKAQHELMVSEHEVYRDACERAEQMLKTAKETATLISDGAKNYADDILVDLQRYMKEYGDIIESNRRELKQSYVAATEFNDRPFVAAEPAEEVFFEENDA